MTTDMMVEGVHFDRSHCPPEWLAHKLLARNASDIAAMGGRALTYVVSLALPRGLDLENASSLGLRLIRSLARQVDGQFELLPRERGTEARLKIPMARP